MINISIFIKNISCGYNHSFILSADGDIYRFGSNEYGQLGNGNKNFLHTPVLYRHKFKFRDINCFQNTSLAMDQESKYYVWGDFGNRYLTRHPVKFNSFQEIIDDKFSDEHWIFSLKPLTFEELFYPIKKVFKTISKAFNNPKNSDLKFKIKRNGSEDFEYIYGHKWFLGESAEHFHTMFANEWGENETKEVVVPDYSYEAYYQYIKCLNTDFIETEDIELLIELLSITEEYFDGEVKDKCIDKIKPLVKIENVCSLYSSAIKYRAKQLKKFCYELMSKNIKLFIETDGYKEMDPVYIAQFFTDYHK